MANSTVNVTTDLPSVNTVGTTDKFLVVTNTSGNAVLSSVSANNLLGNSNVSIVVSASKDFIISKNTTPANSTINATPRSMWFDDGYIYCVTANNDIKRVPLESF